MPPSRPLNNRFARAVAIRPSTLLRNSIVLAAALAVPVPAPAPANTQIVNPTDAGYGLNVNAQATRRAALPNREPFNLNIGPRPTGTPGREDFDLMAVLGLDTYQYRLCLLTMRNIAYSAGIDNTHSITYQDHEKLYESYIGFINTFPEFKEFPDQFWAPQAIMYVTLKSSSESWRKNNPELAVARAAARAREKEASKAAVRARKAARPRGRPKKGAAKGKGKATAVSRTNPGSVDSAAEDFSNMSMMDPDVAAALANMSLDPVVTVDDEDEIAPNQPFFDYGAHPVAGSSNLQPNVSITPFNAMSTPHAPKRTHIDSSSLPTRNHASEPSVVGGHIPGGSSHTLGCAHIPPSSVGSARRTYEHSAAHLNGTTTATVTSLNQTPRGHAELSRALDTTYVPVGNGAHSSGSRPPPIPHSSRPSLANSTSFVSSISLDSHSPRVPDDPRKTGGAHRSSNPDGATLDFGRTYFDRTSVTPGPAVHQGSPQPPIHHVGSTYNPQGGRVTPTPSLTGTTPGDTSIPTSNLYPTIPLTHVPALDAPCMDAVHSVVVDSTYPQVPVHGCVNNPIGAQNPNPTQTASHVQPRPRFAASILALSGGNIIGDAGAFTQSTEQSRAPLQRPGTRSTSANKQGVQVGVSDGEISDTPSATASNYPLGSDDEVVPHARTTKKPTNKGKKNRPAVEGEVLPGDEGVNTTRGKSRGGGRGSRGSGGGRGGRGGGRGGRGRGDGGVVRGRGRSRGRAQEGGEAVDE